jgi:hypothetical protein
MFCEVVQRAGGSMFCEVVQRNPSRPPHSQRASHSAHGTCITFNMSEV